MLWSKLLLAASTLTSVFAQNAHVATTPKAPGLTYLYSSNVTLGTTIDYGTGPKGSRVAIPITGGTFSGPKLKGVSKLTSHFSSLLFSSALCSLSFAPTPQPEFPMPKSVRIRAYLRSCRHDTQSRCRLGRDRLPGRLQPRHSLRATYRRRSQYLYPDERAVTERRKNPPAHCLRDRKC